PIVLNLYHGQGMEGSARTDWPRTPVEKDTNTEVLPLTLRGDPHNLAHRTAGGGDILDYQRPFARHHRKPTAQGHDSSLTLAKDGPHPQSPGHFLPNDNPAHRW